MTRDEFKAELKRKMPFLSDPDANLLIDITEHAANEALKTWVGVIERLPAHLLTEGTAIGIGVLEIKVKTVMKDVIKELMEAVLSKINAEASTDR